MRKSLVFLLMVTVFCLSGVTPAAAEFPDKPITMIVPFNPGGETDITARLHQQHVEKFLGTDLNITYKPGGGGAVAWAEFQRTAKPTGYQITGINIPHIIGQPLLRKDAGYKTDGFEIITWFHFTPNALIVAKNSPFKTLKDYIDYAKKNPKVLTVGGSGTYSANHLETLRLEREAGIKLTYIPHTGSGPLIPAILGGHLSSLMNYTMLGVQLQDKTRVLAIAAEERAPFLPDVPTFRELGYDIVGGAFRGIAAAKGTPKEIVAKLTEAFAYANKQVKEKQEPLGFVLTYYTADKALALVDQMKKNYGDVIKDVIEKKKKKK